MTYSTPGGGTGALPVRGRGVSLRRRSDCYWPLPMRSLPEPVGICLSDRRDILPRRVTITGPLTTYEARIDGNNRLWRHFCQTCGSAISITLDRYPGIQGARQNR